MRILDRYCRLCGKRISAAEDDLYNGHCNNCLGGRTWLMK